MSEITKKVRKHISEGEYKKAIDTLVDFLQDQGGEMYNQAIHIKGQYSDYHKSLIRGTGDNPEVKNKISWAVLDLATRIEQGETELPNKSSSAVPDRNYQQNTNTGNQQSASPEPKQPSSYKAQCFFNGDVMQYFVNQQDQIVCINPITNQQFFVGTKMPSQDFRYAWTYYITANGLYYMVDHAGVIWGQNFGMPAQMGHVKYFE